MKAALEMRGASEQVYANCEKPVTTISVGGVGYAMGAGVQVWPGPYIQHVHPMLGYQLNTLNKLYAEAPCLRPLQRNEDSKVFYASSSPLAVSLHGSNDAR